MLGERLVRFEALDEFLAVPIANGTPSSLTLSPADYWLAWQIDSVADVPVELNRDLDILFVIDNSGSMAEEQASLATNVNRFINVLSNIPDNFPELGMFKWFGQVVVGT